MIIVPYACAEFHDESGAVLFRIRPADLRVTIEAPESIIQDPLFSMMVADGSLRVPETRDVLRQLENDPDAKPAKTEKTPKAAKAVKSAKAEPAEPAAAPGPAEADASASTDAAKV